MGMQTEARMEMHEQVYLTCLERYLDHDAQALRCAQLRDAIDRWRTELRTLMRQPQPVDAYRSLDTLILACDAADNILKIVIHRQAEQRRLSEIRDCNTDPVFSNVVAGRYP